MSHATDRLKGTNRISAPLRPSRTRRQFGVRCVAPNRWCHEVPALVGPFCCQKKATAFACPPVDFGHYEGQRREVKVRGDAFYVYVR